MFYMYKDKIVCKKEKEKELQQLIEMLGKNQENLLVLLDMVEDIQKSLNIYKDIPECNTLVIELSIKMSKYMNKLNERK